MAVETTRSCDECGKDVLGGSYFHLPTVHLVKDDGSTLVLADLDFDTLEHAAKYLREKMKEFKKGALSAAPPDPGTIPTDLVAVPHQGRTAQDE